MTETDEAAARVVDVQGEFCPVPIIELGKAVRKVDVGEIVLLLATDPGVNSDLPTWCKAMGHELISLRREGERFEVRIRRRK